MHYFLIGKVAAFTGGRLHTLSFSLAPNGVCCGKEGCRIQLPRQVFVEGKV